MCTWLPPVLLIAALLPAPALARDRTLTITSFDRIRVEGPFRVEIVTNRGPSARLSGSEAAIERVRVTVQGTTAIVRANPNAWGGYGGEDAGPVTIRLTTPALRTAALTGSGSIAVDAMRAQSVALTLEGAGTIAVARLETDALDVGIAGAGTMTLAGRAAGARIATRGSAGLNAAALTVRDLRTLADGSGSLTVTAERTADVKASGAGAVTVLGRAACTVSNRGSGTVVCGKGK